MHSKSSTGILVGAGFMGKTHLEAYGEIPDVRITAIVDRDGTRASLLAACCSAEAFTDFGEALRLKRPDFVDICLPTPLHRTVLLAAVENGADVLVEKPLALGLEDIEAMTEAAQRTGRRVMVAHVCRFMPQYLYARNLIETERLGKPLFFGAARESDLPSWSVGEWINDRSQSGGTLLDLSIHDIDISNWLLGKPVCFKAEEVVKEKGGPAHTISSLGYACGARASIEASHLMPLHYPLTTWYRLLLEKGFVEWKSRGTESCLSVFTDSGEEKVDLSTLEPKLGGNPYLEEIRHFTDCIQEGRPFRIGLAEASLAVETVLKLRTSMQ